MSGGKADKNSTGRLIVATVGGKGQGNHIEGVIGYATLGQMKDIAKQKADMLTGSDLKAMVCEILGQARSAGVGVDGVFDR